MREAGGAQNPGRRSSDSYCSGDCSRKADHHGAHYLQPDPVIYQKLGLDPRVDYEHAAVGIVTMTPSETAIIAADICMKKSAIEIGFIDRFSGTLIITGRMADVSVALESVLEYTETVMGFTVCNLTKA